MNTMIMKNSSEPTTANRPSETAHKANCCNVTKGNIVWCVIIVMAILGIVMGVYELIRVSKHFGCAENTFKPPRLITMKYVYYFLGTTTYNIQINSVENSNAFVIKKHAMETATVFSLVNKDNGLQAYGKTADLLGTVHIYICKVGEPDYLLYTIKKQLKVSTELYELVITDYHDKQVATIQRTEKKDTDSYLEVFIATDRVATLAKPSNEAVVWTIEIAPSQSLDPRVYPFIAAFVSERVF